MSAVPLWIASLPDEVRIRNRARGSPWGPHRRYPNKVAITNVAQEALSEANLDLEDWQHPDGVLIYGLGLVEPWFRYDNLRSLSRLNALQRDPVLEPKRL